MKKLWLGLLCGVVLASIGVVGARAGVQDFTIDTFEANYYLYRAQDNVAELRVRERIVADIPTVNQNHGILRAIPQDYQGHTLELKVQKVMDDTGQVWKHETYSENGNLVVKIGDPDKYLDADRYSFIIDYTMRGVILNLSDHQEFYWDVNGDQWQQPMGTVSATVRVDESIAAAVESDQACYTGRAGSTESQCSTNANGNEYTFTTSRQLAPGENLTLVMGFTQGTFADYKPSIEELQRLAGLVVLFGLPPLAALVWALRRWWRFGRDPKGKGVIVPQYLPPKEVSVLGASAILREGFRTKAVSATILDLAVRHYIKIYESKEKKIFKDKVSYELELIKDTGQLRLEEQKVVELLFPAKTIGERVLVDRLDSKLYSQVSKLGKSVDQSLVSKGYFVTTPAKARTGMQLIALVVFIASFFFVPWSLGFMAAAAILFVVSFAMPARTAKGVELRDYLLGLRDYMKLAEADRLKALQSPHGDLTEKIDVTDKTQLVKLYEHLLPYAMLFDIEEEWAKKFAGLYAQPPDWYSGSSAFHAAYFATSISSLGAATTSSFTPPSSSSSSGFGGGSSGGGGGGGGGGGW